MQRNVTRIRNLFLSALLLGIVPSCSDAPTEGLVVVGRSPSFDEGSYQSFAPVYIDEMWTNAEDECYTVDIQDQWYPHEEYHCNTWIADAPTLVDEIWADPWGDPTVDYGVYVWYHPIADSDLVNASCNSLEGEAGGYCTATVPDTRHAIESISWEINLPNGESGDTGSDLGPTQYTDWTFSAPPAGSSVTLMYTYSGTAPSQQTLSIQAIDNTTQCTADKGPSTQLGNGSTLNKDAFAALVHNNALSRSSHHCAHYVACALCDLRGGNLAAACNGDPDAQKWGDFLLTTLGFTDTVSGTTSARTDGGKGTNPNYPDGYSPQKGDIAVMSYLDRAGNPSGHVTTFDGTNWVSDYIQNIPIYGVGNYGMNPNPGTYPNQAYTIYRKP